MEAVLSNKDLVIEILYGLCAKDLSRLRCTSKKLRFIISDPYFLRIHHNQQSKNGLSGVLAQFYYLYTHRQHMRHPFYICLDMVSSIRGMGPCGCNTRVLLSTSNGILCCRSKPNDSSFEFEIFIGIPLPLSTNTRCIRITGDNFLGHNTFCLAFYPFGCSSSGCESPPSFKIANIHTRGPQRRGSGSRLFYISIYSSETGKWKIFNEACHGISYPVQNFKHIFANGRFNWLTHHKPYILTFDPEKEKSDLIQLPESECGRFVGESHGYLHCGFCSDHELRIWLLQDYSEPNKWVLKYRLDINDIVTEALRPTSFFSKWETYDTSFRTIHPFFNNDVLVIHLKSDFPFISYNLRTGKHQTFIDGFIYPGNSIDSIMLPCTFSLASMDALKKLTKISDPTSMFERYITLSRESNRAEKRKRADDLNEPDV